MNTESCNCIIEILLKQPFGLHSLESKENIITDGRPTPPRLSITTVAQKCVRHLAIKLYDEVPWLTGCRLFETLFCWPCLLFSAGTNVWTTTGFSDWNNMNKSIVKHGKQSHDHLTCVLMLAKFGSGEQIETLFDSQYNINISKHNEMVKKNRQIMKILIDVVCYLGTQELPCCSHFEDPGSCNRGNYVELIQMLVKHNTELKDHLETSSENFSVLSNNIQNDLIESINSIFSNKIKLEISEATFVALVCDELTDSTNKSQMSQLLRYVDVKGNVQERFIRFQDVSENRCAKFLYDNIFQIINAFNCSHKLICQSYNAAVMSGEINDLQKQVKVVFPEAIYIHCFGHRLNLVLSNSCSRIAECRIFFESLTGFPSYFSHSIKRANAFDALINEKLQRVFPTRWNHNGILLLTIFDHREELIQFFNNIIYIDASKWDRDSVLSARGLIHLLNDFDFVFLLTVFSRIFPETDVLHNILQTKHMDIIYCLTKIEDFINSLKLLRNNFDSVWRKGNSECNPSPKRKIRCTMEDGGEHDIRSYYKRLYIEIIDNIIEEITRRFESLNSIKFLQLVNSSKFVIFSNTFPLQLVNNLKNVYPTIFNINYLKTELLTIYKDTEFKNKSVKEILDYILKYNLEKHFVEFTKLLKLILTIPVTIASVDQNLSTLKRIKSYVINTRASDRFNELAIISIESQKLKSMLTNPEIYEDIIDEFAKQNRQIELNYKMYN